MNTPRLGLAVLFASAMVLTFCGCVTTSSEEELRIGFVGLKADMQSLQEDIAQINGRLESVEVLQDRMRKSIKLVGEKVEKDTSDLHSRLANLNDGMKSAEAERRADKNEIVSTLSERIVEVVKKQAPPPSASEFGYEHTIQPGETLSKLASHYKVTVEAIKIANGITDPNKIRAGDKLFIPR